MKIAIDASRYGHKKATGVEWYSFYIINYLIKEIEKNENIEKLVLLTRDDINLKSNSKVSIKKIPSKRLWTILGLSKEMIKNKYDILFVPSHTLPLFLPKKSVIMIHDLAFKRFKNVYKKFQYYYLDLSTRFACKFASKILVPSFATKNDLIKYYKCPESKISVVYHGYSLEKKNDLSSFPSFYPKMAKERALPDFEKFNYLLFIGRIESKKNISMILKAFKKIKDDYPNYYLVLAGKKGNGAETIVEEIEKLKLINSVIFTGYISEEDKEILYKNAKTFLFPSLYEGFGFPLLESFFYNCPVVCADAGSLPEVGKDACLYINNNDVEDFYKKIKSVIDDDQLRKSLIEKGQIRLKEFDWEKCAKKTLLELIK